MTKPGMRIVAILLFISFAVIPSLFCEDVGIDRLVDRYKNDTDVQKAEVVKEYLGKKISVSGMVNNVSSENTFDVVNDIERNYYKVVTDVENTAAGNPYRAVLIYKNKDDAAKINKGQKITFSGNIIKITDDRLYISVWLSADELTEHEIGLFK
ncbi:MAG: hypothetical protein PHI58_00160 [Candidatus Omnitrophica bacterium]|nr:hypothetical protein [Candidatus Omnitrophota bacterium]